MKLKKRRKSSRHRGTRLCGWAAKKHKGKGSSGGKGMAGTSKHKKTYVIRYLGEYFGRRAKKGEKKKGYKEINLGEIEENIQSFIKKGIAKKTEEGFEAELKDYKVLGDGKLKEKMVIKASAFTKSAKEKIEKSGGKAIEIKQ